MDNFLIFCIFTCNALLGQILTFFGQMDEHIMIFIVFIHSDKFEIFYIFTEYLWFFVFM